MIIIKVRGLILAEREDENIEELRGIIWMLIMGGVYMVAYLLKITQLHISAFYTSTSLYVYLISQYKSLKGKKY